MSLGAIIGDNHYISARELVHNESAQLLLDRASDFQEVCACEIFDTEWTVLILAHLLQNLDVKWIVLFFIAVPELA